MSLAGAAFTAYGATVPVSAVFFRWLRRDHWRHLRQRGWTLLEENAPRAWTIAAGLALLWPVAISALVLGVMVARSQADD